MYDDIYRTHPVTADKVKVMWEIDWRSTTRLETRVYVAFVGRKEKEYKLVLAGWCTMRIRTTPPSIICDRDEGWMERPSLFCYMKPYYRPVKLLFHLRDLCASRSVSRTIIPTTASPISSVTLRVMDSSERHSGTASTCWSKPAHSILLHSQQSHAVCS